MVSEDSTSKVIVFPVRVRVKVSFVFMKELSSAYLDEDLHTTAQAQDEMQSGLLLDVVVGQGAAILELLAGEDQALLIRWDALLVLDLALHIVDGVGRFNFQRDGFSRYYGNQQVVEPYMRRGYERVLTKISANILAMKHQEGQD
jgi:hypothetical protein